MLLLLLLLLLLLFGGLLPVPKPLVAPRCRQIPGGGDADAAASATCSTCACLRSSATSSVVARRTRERAPGCCGTEAAAAEAPAGTVGSSREHLPALLLPSPDCRSTLASRRAISISSGRKKSEAKLGACESHH